MAINYGVKTNILLNKQLIFRQKAIRLILFANYQEHSSALFKKRNLLKLTDMIKLYKIYLHMTQ